MTEPIAWLWQNAHVLKDGCYQFYPTLKRANAEIKRCCGFRTPVYADPIVMSPKPRSHRYQVFDGLDEHRPAIRLCVGVAHAEEIKKYMIAENTVGSCLVAPPPPGPPIEPVTLVYPALPDRCAP